MRERILTFHNAHVFQGQVRPVRGPEGEDWGRRVCPGRAGPTTRVVGVRWERRVRRGEEVGRETSEERRRRRGVWVGLGGRREEGGTDGVRKREREKKKRREGRKRTRPVSKKQKKPPQQTKHKPPPPSPPASSRRLPSRPHLTSAALPTIALRAAVNRPHGSTLMTTSSTVHSTSGCSFLKRP